MPKTADWVRHATLQQQLSLFDKYLKPLDEEALRRGYRQALQQLRGRHFDLDSRAGRHTLTLQPGSRRYSWREVDMPGFAQDLLDILTEAVFVARYALRRRRQSEGARAIDAGSKVEQAMRAIVERWRLRDEPSRLKGAVLAKVNCSDATYYRALRRADANRRPSRRN